MQLVSHSSQLAQLMVTFNMDNMNLKHLEQYSVMAEHDNAGFPLSYCLLSTATSVDIQECMNALLYFSHDFAAPHFAMFFDLIFKL